MVGKIRPEIPIYCTRGTEALIRASAIFLRNAVDIGDVRRLTDQDPIEIGPFTITPHLVDHSAPDAVALEIEADGKKILYTGDIRGHGRKGWCFERMVKRPPKDVDLLLIEGTTISREGSVPFPNEAAVEEGLVERFRDKQSVAMVFASSQNLDRICSVFRAVKRTKRFLVIDVYTAYILDQLRPLSDSIPQWDTNGVRVRFEDNQVKRLKAAGLMSFAYMVKRKKISSQEVVERRGDAVILAKVNRFFYRVLKELPDFDGLELIWSMWSGYLTPESKLAQVAQNHGLEIRKIHTSGHAPIEDLQRLAKAINPRKLVPIHTLDAEAFEGRFANVYLATNGEMITV